MLVAHGELAKEVGVNPNNIFILEDGDVLEIGDGQGRVVDHVEAGDMYIDGTRVWDIKNPALRDRRILGRDGFVVVLMRLDRSSRKLSDYPEVISGGVINIQEDADFLDAIAEVAQAKVEELGGQIGDWGHVSAKVRNVLQSYLYKETGRKPMIIPVLIEL